MIVGIATAQNRISPVFDCAEHFCIYRIEGGIIEKQEECRLNAGSYSSKLAALNQLGIQCIICGAISRELHDMISAHGIEVTAWVSGPVEEIISAFCNDNISDAKFLMPGCLKNTKRCRCQRRMNHSRN